MNNTTSVNEKHHLNRLRTRVEEALGLLLGDPEFAGEFNYFSCRIKRSWLELSIRLRGERSFFVYVGPDRNILNHCRRMCRSAHRNIFQGVILNVKAGLEEIRCQIGNCIRTVLTAIRWNNHSVTDTADAIKAAAAQYEHTHATQPRPDYEDGSDKLAIGPSSLVSFPTYAKIPCGFRF